VHRDLKPQNILLTDNREQGDIKLADFGLAKRYESNEDLFETNCGTPIYMAPEIQRGEQYSDKADLWSVGVILFELVAGFPPFFGKNKLELRQNIENGKYKLPPGVKITECCLHLICLLLQSKVEDRISWNNFFEHPFIKTDEKIYSQIYEELTNPSSNKDLDPKREETKK
jgi:serine/threonine-protein kinase ULK/ATG1